MREESDMMAPMRERMGDVTKGCGNTRTVDHETMRHLTHISQDIAANAFQDMTRKSEVVLVEVACSPDSVLSAQVQHATGKKETAVRCSHWNGCDIGTGAGVKLTMSIITAQKPQHVHISPECGPYSPMQNLNQKSQAQRDELQRKRREVLKQYVGASCIFQFCVQQGIHVTWEWAERCQAWRLPLIQRLQEKYRPHMVVTHGCQVNLRNIKGRLIKKGWKLMTTHKRLADMMDLPCKCPKHQVHGVCEGSETRKTAYYTKEYAKRYWEAIRYELDHNQLVDEMMGESGLIPLFGDGLTCICHELKCREA